MDFAIIASIPIITFIDCPVAEIPKVERVSGKKVVQWLNSHYINPKLGLVVSGENSEF
jgi:hypothetical protein